MIERPENKSNHSKDVILIKRDVSTGEPGNSGTFLYLRKKKMIMKASVSLAMLTGNLAGTLRDTQAHVLR